MVGVIVLRWPRWLSEQQKIAQNIILSNYVVKCPKLTNEQAKEIRELFKSGKYTHQQLADIYNVKD